MADKTIGERIKQTLYEKRMTGFELASKAKISEGGLSQIINNKIVNLKVDTALRIAKALNVSPLWLLLGDKMMSLCSLRSILLSVATTTLYLDMK